MKKSIIASAMISLLIFLSACSSNDNTTYIPVEPATTAKKTTVMVYMEGSDLESESGIGTSNLLQMMNAEHSEYLNVIVQTGASDINYDDPSTIPSGNNVKNPPLRDWTVVQRSHVTHDSITPLGEPLGKGCSQTAVPKIQENCVEMGSSETVQNFIEYSIDKFPADRYILVFWDHAGGSIEGYGSGAAKTMNVNDIKKAIDTASKNKNVKLEIVGFDACLMGNIEFAYNLRNSVNYLVGSEETEPGEGWNYNTVLTSIAKNPKMTGKEIGKTIADTYIAHNKNDEDLTMSVIDLGKTAAVVDALDALSQHTLNKLKIDKAGGWITFFNARNITDEFGSEILERSFVNDIDISYFASALKYYGDESYSQYTENLEKAVSEAVVYSLVQGMHPYATGLSFWLPFNFGGDADKKDFDEYKKLYGGSSIATFSNAYISLLDELLTYANETPAEFKIGDPTVSGNIVEVDVESNFGIDTAILVLDKSDSPEFIEPVMSKMADITHDTAKANMFKVKATLDHSVLTLNSYPIFTAIEAKNSLTRPSEYHLSIPLYYKESMSQQADPTEVVMSAMFDFRSGKGNINITLTVNGSEGREKIELQAGNVLIIPTVKVNAANPSGSIIKEPSSNTIVITDIAGEDRGLTLSFSTYPGTKKYAFALKSLLETAEVSKYFNETGNMPALSLETNNAEKNKPEALREALNKPFWDK